MLRQYTPSHEKARSAYVHWFAYIGEEHPDVRLLYPLGIFSEDDRVQDISRQKRFILEEVAVNNGY